ncbi:MAG TPA: glycosyltransferase 87 family protein, partial [Gaiellaceae bacterium]|nr:glycosyltransferase 87 family protein [Gaiellaceae bacterium]
MSTLRSRPEAAVAAGGLFLLCWGLVHLNFWSRGALVDWPTYQRYGDAILNHGLVPYRDFALEYPPGALAMFIAPAAFGNYAAAFAWQMSVCGVVLVVVVAAIRREAAFYVALAPVLAGSLILSRFDLWPALLTVAALAALLRERHRLGWGLLGAAVAAKLWPFVIVPLALVWS